VRGVRGGVDLDVLGIVNLLAGVDVDKEGHHTILYALALFALGVTSGFGLLAFDARSIPIRAYIRKSTAGQRDGVLKRGGPRQCVAQAIGFWRANEDAETAPALRLGVRVPEPSPCAPCPSAESTISGKIRAGPHPVLWRGNPFGT
jgi:hypothetical protein